MTIADDDARARMNRMYHHQRRFYDLTRRYYLLGRSDLIEALQPPSGGTILEVGCGTASNLIAAARRYPSARLFGFDVSTEMLVTAQQSINKHGLSDRITLAAGDATAFDGTALFNVAAYDRIFTSYTLSMIPQWPVVIEEMSRHLAPNGSIHIVDFGDCARLPAVAKTALYAWLDKFHVSPRSDLQAAVNKTADKAGLHAAYRPLFRGYAQSASLTRR